MTISGRRLHLKTWISDLYQQFQTQRETNNKRHLKTENKLSVDGGKRKGKMGDRKGLGLH